MKPAYVSVVIPTNQSFARQWFNWTYAKVAKNFKRDKERAFDVAQNVRLRFLSKDFIGRWFFKHLPHELVDRNQAERMLGGVPLTFVGSVTPVEVPNFACLNKLCVKRHEQDRGCVRSCSNSLWRVSDLLEFARFDHDRFYYSPQNHTIDSGTFLRLLGYPESQHTLLQSLYRQGRIRPAEFTQHVCIGKSCIECDHGRALLTARRLSLAHNWSDPAVADAASKLRWNDSQLKPFLREWRKTNMVKTTPDYIMRLGQIDESDRKLVLASNQGIDAGLLKYAEILINNEVKNNFKSMSRMDDLHSTIFNKGRSPELSNDEQLAWESDDSEEGKVRVLSDAFSLTKFARVEDRHDLERIFSNIQACGLTEDEANVIFKVDLGDLSIREVANELGKPVQKIHRTRLSALRKLRDGESTIATRTADKYGCSVSDMLSPKICVGPAIVARSHFFKALHTSGISIPEIAFRYRMSEDRVSASIYRASLHDPDHSPPISPSE